MKISMRGAAKQLDIPESTFKWYFRQTKQKRVLAESKSGIPKVTRLVTAEQRKAVLEFYHREEISQSLPSKKYAKLKFLRQTYAQSYESYVIHETSHGRIPVSLTSVHRVLPKKVFRQAGRTPMQNCGCRVCSNFVLNVASGKRHGLKGLDACVSKICRTACCESRDLDSQPKDIYKIPTLCRMQRCKDCSTKFSEYLREQNPDLDMAKPVKWRQWGYKEVTLSNGSKKQEFKRHVYTGTMQDLVNLLKLQMLNMPTHLFNYFWQGDQFQQCLESLGPGEVVMVVDFAKNMQIGCQHEVQSAFFHRKSATLHPVIIYYHCPIECGEQVVDEVMCVTPDPLHDSYAVHTFLADALGHLKKYNIPIEKLYMFSDNCSAQYKSKKPFELLHKIGVPTEWHYFGAGHGKSRADGWTGRFKIQADLAIRGDKAGLEDAAGLAAWGQKALNSKITNGMNTGMCIHYERSVVYIPAIDRSFPGSWRTLKGTRRYHSIKISPSGLMTCRENSCFCR